MARTQMTAYTTTVQDIDEDICRFVNGLGQAAESCGPQQCVASPMLEVIANIKQKYGESKPEVYRTVMLLLMDYNPYMEPPYLKQVKRYFRVLLSDSADVALQIVKLLPRFFMTEAQPAGSQDPLKQLPPNQSAIPTFTDACSWNSSYGQSPSPTEIVDVMCVPASDTLSDLTVKSPLIEKGHFVEDKEESSVHSNLPSCIPSTVRTQTDAASIEQSELSQLCKQPCYETATSDAASTCRTLCATTAEVSNVRLSSATSFTQLPKSCDSLVSIAKTSDMQFCSLVSVAASRGTVAPGAPEPVLKPQKRYAAGAALRIPCLPAMASAAKLRLLSAGNVPVQRVRPAAPPVETHFRPFRKAAIASTASSATAFAMPIFSFCQAPVGAFTPVPANAMRPKAVLLHGTKSVPSTLRGAEPQSDAGAGKQRKLLPLPFSPAAIAHNSATKESAASSKHDVPCTVQSPEMEPDATNIGQQPALQASLSATHQALLQPTTHEVSPTRTSVDDTSVTVSSVTEPTAVPTECDNASSTAQPLPVLLSVAQISQTQSLNQLTSFIDDGVNLSLPAPVDSSSPTLSDGCALTAAPALQKSPQTAELLSDTQKPEMPNESANRHEATEMACSLQPATEAGASSAAAAAIDTATTCKDSLPQQRRRRPQAQKRKTPGQHGPVPSKIAKAQSLRTGHLSGVTEGRDEPFVVSGSCLPSRQRVGAAELGPLPAGHGMGQGVGAASEVARDIAQYLPASALAGLRMITPNLVLARQSCGGAAELAVTRCFMQGSALSTIADKAAPQCARSAFPTSISADVVFVGESRAGCGNGSRGSTANFYHKESSKKESASNGSDRSAAAEQRCQSASVVSHSSSPAMPADVPLDMRMQRQDECLAYGTDQQASTTKPAEIRSEAHEKLVGSLGDSDSGQQTSAQPLFLPPSSDQAAHELASRNHLSFGQRRPAASDMHQEYFRGDSFRHVPFFDSPSLLQGAFAQSCCRQQDHSSYRGHFSPCDGGSWSHRRQDTSSASERSNVYGAAVAAACMTNYSQPSSVALHSYLGLLGTSVSPSGLLLQNDTRDRETSPPTSDNPLLHLRRMTASAMEECQSYDIARQCDSLVPTIARPRPIPAVPMLPRALPGTVPVQSWPQQSSSPQLWSMQSDANLGSELGCGEVWRHFGK